MSDMGIGAGSALEPHTVGAIERAVLTVDELAELLRVDRKTAYSAIAEGKVPGVRRVGRCIRVSRAAVLEWLAQGNSTRTHGRRQ
jgi:excisionase family DNA binding protein